jgi:hypothetical protein
VDAAAKAFLDARGDKKEAETFKKGLTSTMETHPNWRVDDTALQQFDKIVKGSKFQKLPDGAIADANFSSRTEFENKLGPAIEGCKKPDARGK